jgi:23S rRNA (guanosine2251-2'-O)-methyltransferase
VSGKNHNNIIYGRHPIIELVRLASQRIFKLLITESAYKDLKDELNKIPANSIQLCSVKELDHISSNKTHQGCLAYIKEKTSIGLTTLLNNYQSKDTSLLILLDRIEDPHNLGAILRVAECFAADGVIVTERRQAPLSEVAVKSSAGASHLVNLVKVTNLNQALESVKEAHYWSVATVCNDLVKEKNNSQIKKIEDAFQFDFPKRCCLIFGNEGDGISHLLLCKADFLVTITMSGRIDSLNVSQSAAIFTSLYRARI